MAVATQSKNGSDPLVSFDKVRVGDIMAFTYWARVQKTDSYLEKIDLVNVDNDEEFSVRGRSLIQDSKSADQYTSSKTLPRRDVIDILIHSKLVPFTVRFRKKNGQIRVLRGRLIGVREANQGYIDVEDLENDSDDRFRQVDARTIEYVVVGGVKYSVR